MNQAKTTWALVVGLDVYDLPKIKQLQGAARDAIEAVKWLRALGVPDAQILLHASPCPAVQAELNALALPFKSGRQNDITASIAQLAQVPDGTRLFVFLMAHGLYEPAAARLFLLQEAGLNNIWANARLDYYRNWFRSLPFTQQYLFVDGCQNYPYGTNERPTIAPGAPVGAVNPIPIPANGLVACFAAGQDKFALEIDGRGAFSKQLFDVLNLKTLTTAQGGDPLQSAIRFDWTMGTRAVDLDALIDGFVREQVRAVSAANGNEQVVGIEPSGVNFPHLIVQLPPAPTTPIRVLVAPPPAVTDVTRIRIYTPDLFAACDLPRPPAALAVPIDLLAPQGFDTDATCWIQPGRWNETRLQQHFRTDGNVTVNFTLNPPGPPPPRAPVPPAPAGLPSAAPRSFKVKTRAPDGSRVGALGGAHEGYASVAQLAGFRGNLADGTDVGYGVTVQLHEDGPEFLIPPQAVPQANAVVHRWARAVRASLGPEVVVTTQATGTATPGDEARIVFVLPPGGAEALAGALAEHPAVTVHAALGGEEIPPWRDPTAHSLRELEARPVVDVRPGPHHVHLGLPWGSWTQVVNTDSTDQPTVRLPPSVGNPPLRVSLWKELHNAEGSLIVLGDEQPRIQFRATVDASPVVASSQRLPNPGAWRVNLPTTAASGIIDDGGRRVEFPLFGSRGLAIQRGADFRVEPLSAIDAPEWDLLVAKGDLDELAEADATRLTQQKWVDLLLGLGGAYALYARQSWHDLQIVTTNLQYLGMNILDRRLLALMAEVLGETPSSDQILNALNPYISQVPLFRWGVRLARSILENVTRPGADLMRWWSRLSYIERTLAHSSAWTTWADDRSR